MEVRGIYEKNRYMEESKPEKTEIRKLRERIRGQKRWDDRLQN